MSKERKVNKKRRKEDEEVVCSCYRVYFNKQGNQTERSVDLKMKKGNLEK